MKELLSADTCTQIVNQEWHIALSKQKVSRFIDQLCDSSLVQAEVLTIISELGYNLFFHTESGGKICVEHLFKYNRRGIMIESTDSGPGIKNIDLCMQDGFSTNGGLGGGLPGIKRLSDEFYIESYMGGTRVKCVKWFN